VFQLGLGSGDAVEPMCFQPPLFYLLDALGDNNGDISFGHLQVLEEVYAKCGQLSVQTL